MDKKIATIVIGFLLAILFVACSSGPSEQDIQTAIAETNAAIPAKTISTPEIKPTSTLPPTSTTLPTRTPKPTNTPLEPTLTPTTLMEEV